MKKQMTLEQFIQEHPGVAIEIMSPGGYVAIHPDEPLDKLSAHAGVRGSKRVIEWEELREQVVEKCNFNESVGKWYLLTGEPSRDCPVQEPEMQM